MLGQDTLRGLGGLCATESNPIPPSPQRGKTRSRTSGDYRLSKSVPPSGVRGFMRNESQSNSP